MFEEFRTRSTALRIPSGLKRANAIHRSGPRFKWGPVVNGNRMVNQYGTGGPESSFLHQFTKFRREAMSSIMKSAALKAMR